MVVLKQESRFARANDQSLTEVMCFYIHYTKMNHLNVVENFSLVNISYCINFLKHPLLFFQFTLQIEQGVPILSKWLIFNRFKFVASKGVKLGPAFLLTRWVDNFHHPMTKGLTTGCAPKGLQAQLVPHVLTIPASGVLKIHLAISQLCVMKEYMYL